MRCVDDAGPIAQTGEPSAVVAPAFAVAQRPGAPVADPDAGRRDLPGNWIDQMRTAAVAADAPTLRLLAAQLADAQPALAATLCGWIDAYDYDAIQQALDVSFSS